MISGHKTLNWSLLFFLILFIGPASASADDIIRVTTEGTAASVPGDPAKVRDKALQAAEQNALAEALAPEVTTYTLLVNSRLSGSILGSIPYGKIIEKKIVDEGMVQAAKGQASQYRVKIAAKVVEEDNAPAPSFSLKASLNQSTFMDGEELQIRIKSDRNCHFAVFNIRRDDKIIPLLPNNHYKDNNLIANKIFRFPDEKARIKGYKLRVHLPEDKKAISEYIYVIALLHPLALNFNPAENASLETENGQQALIRELVRKVVGIPVENRGEVLMQYHIRRNRKGV